MANTWLEHVESTGFEVIKRLPGGVIRRNSDTGLYEARIVGHPVHFRDESGDLVPITLALRDGRVHGSNFGYDMDGGVLYKGKALHRTRAVVIGGKRTQLNSVVPHTDGNMLVYGIGSNEYRLRFTESGLHEELVIHEPVDGYTGFVVSDKVGTDMRRPAMAYDADNNTLPVDEDYGVVLSSAMRYPVVIDPDYGGITADKYIYGYHATVYATARSTSFATVNNTNMYVGQSTVGVMGEYYVYRGFTGFDTSGLPDSNLTSVTLSMYLITKSVDIDNFDVQIVKYDWSAASQEAAYDGCLAGTADTNIFKNSASMSNGNMYTSGALSTTWPSVTGTTYYGLRSSRDYNNSGPNAAEYTIFASYDHGTAGYRPYLTVVYPNYALMCVII